MIEQLQRLELYETVSLVTFGSYASGVIEKKLEFEGASLISSLYVKAIDSGTTITAEYFESTTGDDQGEDVLLSSHAIPTPGGTNKILVPRPHAKPRLRVTISGTGLVQFGVYVTSTSEFEVDTSPVGVQDVNIVSPNPITTRPRGLNIAGKITQVPLNSLTWTPLPAVQLANRNAISLQNQTNTNIKLNYDNTVSGFEGVLLVPSQERFYDISTIVIYGKCETGSVNLTVEELS